MLGVRATLNAAGRAYTPAVWLAAAVVAALLWAWPAAAAGPAPTAAPLVSCAAAEQRADQAQRAVDACEEARAAAAADKAACGDELSSTAQKLSTSQSRADTCQASRDELCSEAAAFAQRLLDGKVTNVGSCVPGPAQVRLRQFLEDSEAANKALAQLAEFGAGESDALPAATLPAATGRLVARLLGPQHEPLFYRRLLTEAMRLTAPRAWNQIKGGGPAKIEAWFASSDPLDSKLAEEMQHVSAASGQRGPSLSAALHLVRAYQLVAQCSDDNLTSACRRARQLQETFESTTPLLLRQRVEDIWAADCRNVSQGTVLAWVQDFPAPQGTVSSGDFSEVAKAAQAKLFSCFLAEADGDSEPAFHAWLDKMLPSPKALDSRSLPRVDDIRAGARDDTPLDVCGRAARAMQSVTPPPRCTALAPEVSSSIARWLDAGPLPDDASAPLRVCARYTEMLWLGQAVSGADVVRAAADGRRHARASTRARRRRLRDACVSACDDRHGKADTFPADLAAFVPIARGFGEMPEGAPWRADARTGAPLEAARFARPRRTARGPTHLLSRRIVVHARSGLSDGALRAVRDARGGQFYDCELNRRLEARWARHERVTGASDRGGARGHRPPRRGRVRMRRARRSFTSWSKETRVRLDALGLSRAARPDAGRPAFAQRRAAGRAARRRGLGAVGRGTRAVVRAPDALRVKEQDVHHAVEVCAARRRARRLPAPRRQRVARPRRGARGARLGGARRARARCTCCRSRVSRLEWARNASDLLDLVEETSLRGNPFEVRGRITSSSQFWNRERLVSGLLAETRAGRWVVVTGLRRFGKSSLALEVARRLPGLSAYVDLAGLPPRDRVRPGPVARRRRDPALGLRAPHRFGAGALPAGDGARGADGRGRRGRAHARRARPLLGVRAVRRRSARRRCSSCSTSSSRCSRWTRSGSATRSTCSRSCSGRLRNALGESPSPSGAASVGVLLCGALHPLLWAPLRTLGQQSIMGAFPSLCVPCLSTEAASSMMRGLGGRQGIRFADEALDYIVEQSQGVPLLLRRIGTSVLELYDPDHARQGSLGAVNVGIEGAREAVAREEREGSPLRVWVESEIAEPAMPAGAMLRALAVGRRHPRRRRCARSPSAASSRSSRRAASCRALPAKRSSGARRRRAASCCGCSARRVCSPRAATSSSPEAYGLPDGAIRRVLSSATKSRP